jgi:hypothetical protein
MEWLTVTNVLLFGIFVCAVAIWYEANSILYHVESKLKEANSYLKDIYYKKN